MWQHWPGDPHRPVSPTATCQDEGRQFPRIGWQGVARCGVRRTGGRVSLAEASAPGKAKSKAAVPRECPQGLCCMNKQGHELACAPCPSGPPPSVPISRSQDVTAPIVTWDPRTRLQMAQTPGDMQWHRDWSSQSTPHNELARAGRTQSWPYGSIEQSSLWGAAHWPLKPRGGEERSQSCHLGRDDT